MTATTRWVYFDTNSDTIATGATNLTQSGVGTIGHVTGSTAISGVVTITAGVDDQMQVALNGGAAQQITLTSGTNIDARAVARDIEFKLKQLPSSTFDAITVEYINNKFRIRSSSLGTNSSADISHGTNSCLHLLGMASSQGGSLTRSLVTGVDPGNGYPGTPVIGGTYAGQFADIYTVMIGTEHTVSGAIAAVGNTYAGTVSVAGDWNTATAETYTVTIDTTNGLTMGNGTGNVPTFTVTSTVGDNDATPVEMLYANYWYAIGTKGLRIKFTDSPFTPTLGDSFNIVCTPIAEARTGFTTGTVGAAKYVWSSLREGKSSSATLTSTVGTAVGTKGVTIAFSAATLTRRDSFRIICSGPQPTTLGITILNYGSVTVSTYSPCKSVWFELMSGAVALTNTKFGLQSHGTAQHHNANNNDTWFSMGTAGEKHPSTAGNQWTKGITGTDISSDTPPSTLYYTENNMPVVSTADASIPIGVPDGEMATDFIFLAIKLGSLEAGSNASITWRIYFDFQ